MYGCLNLPLPFFLVLMVNKLISFGKKIQLTNLPNKQINKQKHTHAKDS